MREKKRYRQIDIQIDVQIECQIERDRETEKDRQIDNVTQKERNRKIYSIQIQEELKNTVKKDTG